MRDSTPPRWGAALVMRWSLFFRFRLGKDRCADGLPVTSRHTWCRLLGRSPLGARVGGESRSGVQSGYEPALSRRVSPTTCLLYLSPERALPRDCAVGWFFPFSAPSESVCGCGAAIPPAGSDSHERAESGTGKPFDRAKARLGNRNGSLPPIKWYGLPPRSTSSSVRSAPPPPRPA